MTSRTCAYCGIFSTGCTRDHVFPRSLYPDSHSNSRTPRLTVPACRLCNASWEDDEPHFRNILMITGQPNAAVRELWKYRALPSFIEKDGRRRVSDVFNQMRAVEINGQSQHLVYPGNDERVTRVLRKIVRGLAWHHLRMSVPESVVWADILKYEVPSEFLDQMSTYHREPDIAEYRFQECGYEGISSVWVITLFESRQFIGIISEN